MHHDVKITVGTASHAAGKHCRRRNSSMTQQRQPREYMDMPTKYVAEVFMPILAIQQRKEKDMEVVIQLLTDQPAHIGTIRPTLI